LALCTLHAHSILAKIISDFVYFFRGKGGQCAGGSGGLLVAGARFLSFAMAFPRAFAAALFLGVVVGFGAFRGGEISAQSEPGDVDPPARSSAMDASMCSGAGGSALSPPHCLDSQDALACKILCVPGLPDR
jgi:hypothetical protein